MPAALSIDTRRMIVERRQQGETFRSIAETLSVSYEGVRHIWQHWQAHGTLAPRYQACGRSGIRYPQAVFAQAVALKRAHPRWGAPLIRLKLCDEFGKEAVPQVRTLQSWFRQAGVNRTSETTQKKSTCNGVRSSTKSGP